MVDTHALQSFGWSIVDNTSCRNWGIFLSVFLLIAILSALWLASNKTRQRVTIMPFLAGLDAGANAQTIAGWDMSLLRSWGASNPWLRIGNTPSPAIRPNADDTTATAGLRELREIGFKIMPFLRLPVAEWRSKYLPDDLRESYKNARRLGAAYGDLVDAWEVDNEPDLGFVPESAERYTAFLKATYLGLKAGAREQRADGGSQTSDVSHQRAGSKLERPSSVLRPPSSAAKEPLIVFGALGLPPGPWLERFAANDGFAYTDGYNYHYYGYAEDFTGVYQQHEAALKQLTTDNTYKNTSAISATSVFKKDIPVFMTEIGYGMLDKVARDTKEGRLRQWRWFKSVGQQIATLRPEAPMAFYLPPFYDSPSKSEFGLTVSAVQRTEDGGQKPEEWIAGGIKYAPGDFGAEKAEPWMKNIGKEIGGNQATPALAQWLAARRGSLSDQGSRLSGSATTNLQPIIKNRDGARAWVVSAPHPSPIVIDFLPGDGLSHVKRYNGIFVTSREPLAPKKPETGEPKPEVPKPKPPEPPRSEEFILQVRTQNGNLYEVYPTRQATSDWQRFIEPGDNFTMAFYGRAALPWRFKENKPVSLVMVMYPKSLPATYEFRQPQLIKLGRPINTEIAENAEKTMRYGQGKVVIYNFSDKTVSGRLILPEAVGRVVPNTPSEVSANTTSSVLKLLPNERREIPVSIKVLWNRYERIPVEISFIPVADNPQPAGNPVSRFRTDLIPDIGGMPATHVASLLSQEPGRVVPNAPNNREIALSRPRAAEEAPMTEQAGWFVQPGANVERTIGGFSVTVTALPPGKSQRIEVEIPCPNGLTFGEDEFLSVEFRLRPWTALLLPTTGG